MPAGEGPVHGPDLRLRQVAVVTRDSATVEADPSAILGIEASWRYEGVDQYGLGTVFLPVGNEFLEVVVAAEPGTSADRFIDRRGGDGGFIVMLECRDLDVHRARIEAAGARVVDTADSPGGRYLQIHPSDTAGTYVQLVEPRGDGVGDDDGPWLYGGPDWRARRRLDLVTGLVGAEIQCAGDPRLAAGTWAALLGATPTTGPAGDPTIGLRGGHLRFAPARDGRGNGLGAIDVTAPRAGHVHERARARGRMRDDGLVEIGGLRIHVVETPPPASSR